jgi:monoamine oxidase
LVELEAAILEFNKMASTVPADKPWTAPQAGTWDQLGRGARFGVAVRAVDQTGSGVALHSDSETFHARRAILTMPKTLLGRITFDPPLPPAVDQLLQREPMGSVLKVNAVYARPFWRERGLNGSATSGCRKRKTGSC